MSSTITVNQMKRLVQGIFNEEEFITGKQQTMKDLKNILYIAADGIGKSAILDKQSDNLLEGRLGYYRFQLVNTELYCILTITDKIRRIGLQIERFGDDFRLLCIHKIEVAYAKTHEIAPAIGYFLQQGLQTSSLHWEAYKGE